VRIPAGRILPLVKLVRILSTLTMTEKQGLTGLERR